MSTNCHISPNLPSSTLFFPTSLSPHPARHCPTQCPERRSSGLPQSSFLAGLTTRMESPQSYELAAGTPEPPSQQQVAVAKTSRIENSAGESNPDSPATARSAATHPRVTGSLRQDVMPQWWVAVNEKCGGG